MLVRSRMTSRVWTASPETIAQALSTTRTHRIRHLPGLSGERLVELVTDRDLRAGEGHALKSGRAFVQP